MKALVFALLLLPPVLRAQQDCSPRYVAVADELDRAKDSLASQSDVLYDPIEQMLGMVRMKTLGARAGRHCTALELQQLDQIESALFRKGLAVTKEQLEAQRRAKEKAEWNAALVKFSKNIELLDSSK